MITRVIHTRFWEDEFVSNLSPKEKLYFLYLITNSKINISGIFELPDKLASFATGLSLEEVQNAKDKLVKANKICTEDAWIKVNNVDKYNNYTSSPNNKIAKERELLLVPKKLFLDTSIYTSIDTPINHKSEIINHKSEIKNYSYPKESDSAKVVETEEEYHGVKYTVGRFQVTDIGAKELYEQGWRFVPKENKWKYPNENGKWETLALHKTGYVNGWSPDSPEPRGSLLPAWLYFFGGGKE